MSTKTINVTDQVHEYMLAVSLREPEILHRLREETAKLEAGGMQMSPEQGQFMRLLIHLLGAKRTLEVGVFTGYSSLSVALALPDDGQIIACDVSEEYTSIARRYWQAAGMEHKIQLKLGPAVATLDKLLEAEQHNQFDFAFIDADKENYARYYEQCLQLVRRGGLIGIDNTLWGGSLVDESKQDESTNAIRALNQKLHADDRVELSMVPIGDGFTLARKR
ncbi:class I SAM-dependent methyltransferase [soil metagenome]